MAYSTPWIVRFSTMCSVGSPDAVMDRVIGAIAVSFGLGGGRPGGTIPQ